MTTIATPEPATGSATGPVLKLPELDASRLPAGGIVRRAVTLMLAVMVGTVVIGVIGVSFVTMKVTVNGSGQLEPKNLWRVRASSPGRVVRVLVASGDTVAPEQPLIVLSHNEADLMIEQLTARLSSAKLDIEQARATAPFERLKAEQDVERALARRLAVRAGVKEQLAGFEMGQDVDSILAWHEPGRHVATDRMVSDLRMADLEVRAAETQLQRLDLLPLQLKKLDSETAQVAGDLRAARARRGLLDVRAPAAGVVLSDVESLIGKSLGEGDPVLDLADVSEWKALLEVSERAIHRIHVGDEVSVTIAALSSMSSDPFRGIVSAVAVSPDAGPLETVAGLGPSGPRSPGAYKVIVALQSQPSDRALVDALRLGYTVTARIVTRSATALTLMREYFKRQVSRARR
jgi:multidrug efflux pump subunit AcrA (membrane-fusion protein)